jgi:uroporphyrinogen III methyltransferase/synthase
MSKVYLVGAGPGDPELITLKGRRVIAQADSVLYDHLASEALLELAPPHAERLYVGKKKSVRAFSQEQISAMLIDRALRGLRVVRLKGGDPFIFGRGGEELEALAVAGIPFEVVPGVTSALGIAAYTGVPLTYRGHSTAVTFVTGHSAEGVDWSKTGVTGTLVLYMGITEFAAIARELIRHGRSKDTPAIAVRWGTRPDQRTLAGTLQTLPGMIAEHDLKPPATIIIGDVAALHDRFGWYERLPLFGRRIVVTRDRSQAGELSGPLHALGADVIEVPAIEIQPAQDPAPLDAAIARLDSYDWLIFTSANGVRHFIQRLDNSEYDVRRLRGRICAIGPATRSAVQALHLKVDLMPDEYVAESLVEAFRGIELDGRRILLPRAAVARDVAPNALAARGAKVDVVEAYRSVVPAGLEDRVHDLLGGDRRPHWITFTSSSTAKNFIAAAGAAGLDGVRVASIGPVTSETIRGHGLSVHAEARPYTIPGLIDALQR